MIGLTCLFAVQANSLPKTKEKVETDVHPYTISNETTSEKNTIEKILEEIANASGREMNGEEDGHQRNKRYTHNSKKFFLSCTDASNAFFLSSCSLVLTFTV